MAHRAEYEVRKGAVQVKEERQLRVAIYTRVSTEEQAQEGFSLEGQLERLRSYCRSRDWKIAGEYVDAGHSGREIKHREKYLEMLGEIDRWDSIVVMKMDRIHRSSKNFLAMMEELARHGKDFVSITESLDTETAMGRFVMDILQRIAQLESEQIGERTAFGMVTKAKTEERIFTGAAAFGYAWSQPSEDPAARELRRGTGDLVVVQDEAQVVRQIYKLASDGTGRGKISTTLGWCTCVPEEIRQRVPKLACPICKEEWIQGGSGPRWNARIREEIVKHVRKDHGKTIPVDEVLDAGVMIRKLLYRRWDCTGCQRVAYILKNPLYSGFFTWSGKIYQGKHEAIIPRELFEKVQARRRHLQVVLPSDEPAPAAPKARARKPRVAK